MAKRKSRKSGGKRKMPIAIGVGILLGIVPGLAYGYGGYKAGGIQQGLSAYSHAMTGFNFQEKTFNANQIMNGLVPLVVGTGGGIVAHKGASKYVNRHLPKGLNF